MPCRATMPARSCRSGRCGNDGDYRTRLSGCGHTWTYRAPVAPNQPGTPKHGVRISDDLWGAAMRKAHDNGETLTDVIIRLLTRYVRGYYD